MRADVPLRPSRQIRTAESAKVTVVDLHNLPDRAKRFVVGVTLRRAFDEKEASGAPRPLLFVVLDELNKYAPREGQSPIKDILLDVAERGRSLGIILIGAAADRQRGRTADHRQLGVPRRRPARRRRGDAAGVRLPPRPHTGSGPDREAGHDVRQRNRRSPCHWWPSSRSPRGRPAPTRSAADASTPISRVTQTRIHSRVSRAHEDPPTAVRRSRSGDRPWEIFGRPPTAVRHSRLGDRPWETFGRAAREDSPHVGLARRQDDPRDLAAGRAPAGPRRDRRDGPDRNVDLVLVAGDLYESAAPTADAETVVLRALLDLHDTGAKVVVIAGNHDNPARFEAIRPLMGELGITVLGHVARPEAGGVLEHTTAAGAARAPSRCSRSARSATPCAPRSS